MKLTKELLLAVMPYLEDNLRNNRNLRGTTVDDVVTLMNKYAEGAQIDSPLRWAHYLAQIAHESYCMLYTEEIASGAAYDTGSKAKALGNTPEKDGDGQKYKGRGLIQLTGRANYEAYKEYCGFDVVAEPELLSKKVGAIRSSMWFWTRKNLNKYADGDNLRAVTLRVNGGYNGYKQRKTYLDKAKDYLGI